MKKRFPAGPILLVLPWGACSLSFPFHASQLSHRSEVFGGTLAWLSPAVLSVQLGSLGRKGCGALRPRLSFSEMEPCAAALRPGSGASRGGHLCVDWPLMVLNLCPGAEQVEENWASCSGPAVPLWSVCPFGLRR